MDSRGRRQGGDQGNPGLSKPPDSVNSRTRDDPRPRRQPAQVAQAVPLSSDFPELSQAPAQPANAWGQPRAWGRLPTPSQQIQPSRAQGQPPTGGMQVLQPSRVQGQDQPQRTSAAVQHHQVPDKSGRRILPMGLEAVQGFEQKDMGYRPSTSTSRPISAGSNGSKTSVTEQVMVAEPIPVYPDCGWLTLPSLKEEIEIPVRVGTSKEFTKNKITIALNHFPLTIKLPEIFMYHVEVKRAYHKNQKPKTTTKPKKKDLGDIDGDGKASKFPNRLLQKILKVMRVYLTRDYETKVGKTIGIASDFVSNVYTTKRLEPIGLIHTIDISKLREMRIEDPDPVEDETGTFLLTLTPTDWEIDFEGLAGHINNMEGCRDMQAVLELATVYNAVMKAMPNYKYLAMGRSLLIRFPPEGQDGHHLGGGLSSWAGISACINPGWKFFLNLELAYSTMRVGDYVIPALHDFFGDDATNVLQWTLEDIEKGSNYLKSAKVQYCPKPGITRGGTVLRIDQQPPNQATFLKDGMEITVEQYYLEQYNLKLKYPKGPLLVFSGKGSKVPAELCKIKSGQSVNRRLTDQQTRAMVTIARKYPNELESDILRATRELKLNNNDLFNRFGVKIEDKMLELQCRVIDSPVISYGRPGTTNGVTEVNPDKGVWLVWKTNFRFKKPAAEAVSRQWGIFIFGNKDQKAIDDFSAAIVQVGKTCGLIFTNKPFVQNNRHMNDKVTGNTLRDNQQHNQNVKTMVGIFTEFQQAGCTFVVVVLPCKPSRFYGQVKQASELVEHGVGLLTQCIVNQNFNPRPPKKMNSQSSTVQQILLKINSKLDGISHSVSLPQSLRERYSRIDFPNLQEAVLVIGADVTHPPPGTAIRDPKDPRGEIPVPSFASVTGSIDRTCMPYMMHVQAQKRIGKGAAEVIPNLGDIVANFIKEFFRKNRALPGKIIYYRDGVGEGQFKEILHIEMRGMRNACAQFDKMHRGIPYMPKITFITVQKRHKTRFFKHTDKKTDNAPPGTVVDSHIVHPTEMDFYLLSHQAIQGTSRPTRYHVLWDDSEFSQDEIQIMTYYMCYMYGRCNRSVKIPAPTYYAHWAAARAKALAEGNEHLYSDNLTPLNDKLQRMGNFKLNFPMHFI